MLIQTAETARRTTASTFASTAQEAAPVGLQVNLDKHSPVFHAGDDAERFYEVEAGAAMVYRVLDDGRRQLVEVVFPGGICGLEADEVYESSCETLTPSVLRSYKAIDLARSDALRLRVVRKLKQQVNAMHEHAVSLGRKTAEERVCSFILRLCERDDAIETAACSVALPMSRTELADYLGLTLETVCRTITSLSRRKILSGGSNKSEITVPSIGRLRQAAASWGAI